MYYIIGADGRQYGPVTPETLREWIAQGRANAKSRVLLEGTSDWRTLSELGEFSGDLRSAQMARGPSAMASEDLAETLAREILARDYEVDISSCFRRGWNLVWRNFWPAVGVSLLMNVLVWAVYSLPVIGFLLSFVFLGGLEWYFLKQVRGSRAELGDAFAGFGKMFVPLMIFSLVAQVLAGVGLLLCVVPGIYLIVAWLVFGGLLILDKGLDFWPAMELSRKVVQQHWWQVFGLGLVCCLLLLLGLCASLVGFLVAFPVATAACVFAYEDIFGQQPSFGVAELSVTPEPPAPGNT